MLSNNQVCAFPPLSSLRVLKASSGPDSSLSPARLIADAVQRSTKAHLFQLYPVLCEITASPRKTPAAWMASHGTKPSDGEADGAVEELDARTLARQCLNEIGKEMGMEA